MLSSRKVSVLALLETSSEPQTRSSNLSVLCYFAQDDAADILLSSVLAYNKGTPLL